MVAGSKIGFWGKGVSRTTLTKVLGNPQQGPSSKRLREKPTPKTGHSPPLGKTHGFFGRHPLKRLAGERKGRPWSWDHKKILGGTKRGNKFNVGLSPPLGKRYWKHTVERDGKTSRRPRLEKREQEV
ncbi:hypothetical protein JTE90_022579 [Oedothorax gibbosus]|uniref:Uncharacterized protein n=1 Tax=Oedothorax gibbosus TaxID=931172 RepID=A0AAV6TQF2_9ARAC|nr:hypothetical protein JTE90_022579 [Oedothorax gibbosus]